MCFNPLNQVYVFNVVESWENFWFSHKGLNPLNQVYVFNSRARGGKGSFEQISRLNPLNQVYVFNTMMIILKCLIVILSLNPLNQVYVFNWFHFLIIIARSMSLNPLNQVYVFNLDLTLRQLILKELVGLNPLNQVYVFNQRMEV